jgi:uncharacterized domain HDIG
MVTTIPVLISIPLNFLYHEGMVGNVFGNGVEEYLMRGGMNIYLSNFIGSFYIDFVDKLLTLGLLALLLFIRRKIKKRREKKLRDAGVAVLLVIAFSAAILSQISGSIPVVRAAESELDDEDMIDEEEPDPDEIDFYSYFQTTYDSDNGISCGTANAITETNDGILWIGTYAGLYRYNGREFKWMNSFESVKNVNCLYVDPEGRLWIGTNDNGLSVSINETVTNTLDENSGLPSNTVRSITMSADGYYYIGTASSVQVLQLSGGMNIMNEIPEVVYARDMDADDYGNVAAVTSKGDLFLIRDRQAIYGPRACADDKFFTACHFREDGYLYVADSGNDVYIYQVVNDELQLKQVLCARGLSHINTLYETAEGNLFVCADNGLGYFTPSNTFKTVNTNSFNNSIDGMIVDYQGDYWLTSSRLGMLRMSPSAFSDVYGYCGLENKVVNSVAEWNNRLYIGTDAGLDIISRGEKVITNDPAQKAIGEVRIRCIEKDAEDNLWISTYGSGLLKVKKDGKLLWFNEEKGFTDWIRCTRVLSDGTIVVGSDIGATFIKEDQIETTIPFGKDFLESKILCFLQMDDGRVMVGSDGDGIAILNGDKVERKIKTADGLSSNVILRIVAAKKDSGYFIVASNGLCYMSESGDIRILDKFPYFNNFDIWETNDGTVFVLGGAGIYVMSEEDIIANTGDAPFEILDSKRGLLDAITANSWNCEDEEENLYISTDIGVYKLNLEDYGSMKNSYRMKVTNAVMDGVVHHVERGSDIVLDRDNARLELDPEIINYTVEDPTVQYMLIGFDAEATELPSSELSSVVYTNLPTGDYTFRMAIVDNEKNVIEESTYRIIKEEEIFDHWWFRIYMILVAGIAVAWFTWFLARTRIQRTLEYQKRELAFARRQLELGNQTILAIAKTVDAKDKNTSYHSQRVSEYSVMLARELGFTEEECENIRRAGLLHDIGKIGIPDRVLNKKGRLDDEEYALMKTHVTFGGEILKDFTIIEHAADGAMYHHEKYDGTGYMMGLKGEEIPLYGRIIAVADAFDAMTQNRVYREKQDITYVKNELIKCSGTQFDPKIAEIMLKFIDQGVVPIGDKDLLRTMKKHEQEEEERLHEED